LRVSNETQLIPRKALALTSEKGVRPLFGQRDHQKGVVPLFGMRQAKRRPGLVPSPRAQSASPYGNGAAASWRTRSNASSEARSALSALPIAVLFFLKRASACRRQ